MCLLIEKASDDEIRILIGAFNRRAKVKRQTKVREVLSSLQVGDRVRMVRMKPKYLNGTGGTVMGFKQTRVIVRLDPDTDPRAIRRFGWEPACGAAGLEKV